MVYNNNNADKIEWSSQQSLYNSVSQPLWDRGPVNSCFIRRGPGPNKFTRQYLSNVFFKFIHETNISISN